MLKVSGKLEYKGFLLGESFSSASSVLVLTGRNGSGKTRFLESIKRLASVADCGGGELAGGDIVLFQQSALVPNFSLGYNDLDYASKVQQTIDYFERSKRDFIEPYSDVKAEGGDYHVGGPLSYAKLYRLCQSISGLLGKAVEDLTSEDVKLHFHDALDHPFGSSSLAVICNSYRRRIEENAYNIYRAQIKKLNVSFVPEAEVASCFGPKPWETINSILRSVFDGKFLFSVPDEACDRYTYFPQLLLWGSDELVKVEDLSSGEKTLLWLALTLFNIQYESSFVLNAPKLLLIDEPDAFLHPKMVEKMYVVLESFARVFGSVVIITTHSPTTVALAPDESVFVVSERSVTLVDKDLAISDLLDGVNQISIDPENRRHVFVESFYDSNIYGLLFSHLRRETPAIDSKISLSFVPSGEKLPQGRIVDALRGIARMEEDIIVKVVAAINGVGSCSHVYAAVESFGALSGKYVWGIVDWDEVNVPTKGVVVFAQDYAYTTENLALDPLSILLLLHLEHADKYTFEVICGEDVFWTDWMMRSDLLQVSLDRFVEKIIDDVNARDVELSYTTGKSFFTDNRYLRMKGGLERKVLEVYPELKGCIKNGPEKDLKYTVVNKSMLRFSRGAFIPVQFLDLFTRLQRV
jgi:ABC-type multidrug transport system ATPase subunit